MKSLLTIAMFLISTSITNAQDTVSIKEKREEAPMKRRAEKNVKTNGKISTSGCETASGKTIAEGDFGYADCVKQIGLKKKDKKLPN